MSSQTTPTCSLSRNNLPSFTPVIYGLSQDSSKTKAYTVVYIIGKNFLPNGTTYVKFTNIDNIQNTYNIQVIYYSSMNISFIVPSNLAPGKYNVTVVNIYSGNLSLPVQYTYTPNLNYSNSITYTIL
jgi:uncharacterized protein (TIGR03437 family)